MAVKKSQLYRTLWESCNALRGSMDASQYKDYVLMILFVKYLSDKAHQNQTRLIIPDGCFFEDFVALKQNDHIGELINEKLEAIREANAVFIGDLTLPNFNDATKLGETKTRTETLSKLIGEFQRNELDFGKNRASDDDLLGDAYEYLMKNFAAESGKSKGQFYTPAEVSRIMAKVLHLGELHRAGETIYDPTCGSGSLLLRALNETATGKCAIRGQELDSTTASLAKLNMLLHGIVTAQIRVGDTLNSPKFTRGGMLETFDVCVANPPFSKKNWLDTGGESDEYHRWSSTLLAPKKCGDFAFLQHLIASMKEGTGRGACILPHGVLFRGNAEYLIRRDIVSRRLIKGIIGLPANLFFGTGIPACIIIIDKAGTDERNGIFMIDAKDGFQKDGAKNRLREQDIKLIVDTWEAQKDVPHYSKFVSFADIVANDYNLNIPRYITPEDKEIRQDIYAHLHGGLPAHDVVEGFSHLWEACPSLKDKLFHIEANGYYSLVPDADSISSAINADSSYQKQNAVYAKIVDEWCQKVAINMLESVKEECEPKALIELWGNMLMERAKTNLKLVDPYDVYEILMNYWTETMQDDCYMVSRDGWKVALSSSKKKPIFEDLECDLLPVSVVVNKFFASDYSNILIKRGEVEQLNSELESLQEENPDAFDDGLYEMLEKVNEANVKKAVAAQKKHTVDADSTTVKVWSKYLELCTKKKGVSKTLSALIEVLSEKVRKKYDGFTAEDIRELVIKDKWLQELRGRSEAEKKRVCESISSRVSVLNKRYAKPLPLINEDVAKLSQEVEGFLKAMGINF